MEVQLVSQCFLTHYLRINILVSEQWRDKVTMQTFETSVNLAFDLPVAHKRT